MKSFHTIHYSHHHKNGCNTIEKHKKLKRIQQKYSLDTMNSEICENTHATFLCYLLFFIEAEIVVNDIIV